MDDGRQGVLQKIETELHNTVDSPAVQKVHEELTALSNQREQQEVADDDAYRYATQTEKEPLFPVRQADRQRHIRTTAETRTCSFAAIERV